jgi:hypothetical protein
MMWLADGGVSGAAPPESRKWFKAAACAAEAGELVALIFEAKQLGVEVAEESQKKDQERGHGGDHPRRA